MRISAYISFTVFMTFSFISCQQSADKNKVQKFGGEISLTDTLTLAAVYESPEKYEGKEILLTGKITQVCQMRGCWMKLSDGKRELIVRFKDYGFFVPKDAASSLVTVQGIFTTKPDMHMHEEARAQEKGEAFGHPEKHDDRSLQQEQDQRKSEMEPVQADASMPFSFVASAVEIYGPEISDL